jgi:hypothetical protein
MFAYIQTVDCAYSLTPGSKTMLISAGNKPLWGWQNFEISQIDWTREVPDPTANSRL